MSTALLFLVIAAADTPETYLPCTKGLSIEYRVEDRGTKKDLGIRFTDTVRGPGRMPHTCVIDRKTKLPDGRVESTAFVRELLKDRITYAGELGFLTALRPPLLVSPVQRGHKWHFNRTDFSIAEVGGTFDIPAGTIQDCVRVVERSPDKKHEAYAVYAPGVGLILSERGKRRHVALRVKRGAPSVRPARKRAKAAK